MKNIFGYILHSAAYATSCFVKKMYTNDEINNGNNKDLSGYKYETTITILNENDEPILVTRATSRPENGDSLAMPVIKPVGSEYESTIRQNSVQQPVMQQPVVQQPVVQEPVMQQPVVQQPVVQEPVMQQPVIQEPVVSPQNVVAQNVEIPKVQVPTINTKNIQKIQDTFASEVPAVNSTIDNEQDRKKKIEILLKKYSNAD